MAPLLDWPAAGKTERYHRRALRPARREHAREARLPDLPAQLVCTTASGNLVEREPRALAYLHEQYYEYYGMGPATCGTSSAAAP